MAGAQVFRVFGCVVSVLRGNAAAVCGERHGKKRICFSHLRHGNKEYDLAGKYNIEWYSADGDPDSTDYESAIWIPIIPKK